MYFWCRPATAVCTLGGPGDRSGWRRLPSRKTKADVLKPVIALVGRPNVGKSTLFNRLTSSRDAIVADFAGLTRDRHYGKAEWRSRVTPGTASTMASRDSVSLLNNVDFPTLGRPNIATTFGIGCKSKRFRLTFN